MGKVHVWFGVKVPFANPDRLAADTDEGETFRTQGPQMKNPATLQMFGVVTTIS